MVPGLLVVRRRVLVQGLVVLVMPMAPVLELLQQQPLLKLPPRPHEPPHCHAVVQLQPGHPCPREIDPGDPISMYPRRHSTPSTEPKVWGRWKVASQWRALADAKRMAPMQQQALP